ncbi:MAG: bifunctional phosphoribosylaminoimidazolecarboxamide formyltransferase/IMP cyclohydrolase PurH [Candidatus Muiribacterium halophilum]|uniref:Bifunctional purine biosynthesis protein PurH n=1 Tax=Muiribacterium halophilum TaxID=2053465 RepID=A0A2N5ZCA4_MUIH1|nr:MAG: bifunctional phosphoribosylaminoimidazolecarboxamide formyltransferase/IMP cyclohydrolase PurH [Candidatus Muirbacterium halophilum]
MINKKQALISVWDKTDLEMIASKLVEKDYGLIATGSTSKYLQEKGFNTKTVKELTGFPEILDGRVKTLHPKVFGGILYNRNLESHKKEIASHEIDSIDIVVCNLYPFEDVLDKGLTEDELIEYIDIGGVSLIRAAAKAGIPVLCEPCQYKEFTQKSSDAMNKDYLRRLAVAAFIRTAEYDSKIANHLSNGEFINLSLEKTKTLRYGENPHQKAHLYKKRGSSISLCDLDQKQGKDLSYNNLMDTDAALNIIKEFMDKNTCVILKHANSCGLAQGENRIKVYEKALSGDPMSAFGGIVAVNFEIEEDLAIKMNEHFFEIVIAPAYSEKAIEIFSKKKNLRVLVYKGFDKKVDKAFYDVEGGMLVQDRDWFCEDFTLRCVTNKKPDEKDLEEALFAFKAVKNVKSNAIVMTKDNMLVGMGAGQPSRVDSMELAIKKAGEKSKGSCVASDAFFPFPDAVEKAAQNGVKVIVQPGGSIRDKKVIKKADELGIVMLMTGKRHFKH